MSEIRVHRCNACGKVEQWNDSWSWKYIFHDNWEETIKACCKECEDKLSQGIVKDAAQS